VLGLSVRRLALSGAFIVMILPAHAQAPNAGPPVIGIVTVDKKPVTDRTELSGRIQAEQRVALVARVTAFLDKQLFQDGAEVRKGELLYRLERGPFEADVEIKKAEVAHQEAQGEYADLAYARATQLLEKSAGSQSATDNARAAQRSASAQIASAQAQLRLSQINLDYTEIRSPIDGRIGRTSVTEGNVVGPTSGTLATVVSQDPMQVVFPMSVRGLEELRDRNADKGGLDAVNIRLRLPNGKIFGQVGKLDFVDVSVATDTDTIVLRGTIANPVLPSEVGGATVLRELINDEFVTVIIESSEPTMAISIPRAAVLSDQQGDYVYVVGDNNIVQLRRINRGPSTPTTASVLSGLNEGEKIVLEGIQRARPGAAVSPVPATATVPGNRS